MPRNAKISFDRLQMYFGEPYIIDVEDAMGSITIYSPTIGDIIHIGEKRFFQTLNLFICNTTQYRVILWDMGIDWNTLSDFELFAMLYKQIDPEVSKLIFKDLDFTKFEPMLKKASEEDDGTLVLWDNDDQIEINKNVHNHFSQYLRAVFGINPEEKITTDSTLKGWYIEKDRRAMKRSQELEETGKQKEYSGLQPIVSSLVNHPGFKYKLNELREVGVSEFYDSVKRLQIYEQSTALLKGMYSGFIDSKNLKPETYNFMRDID